MKNKILIGVLFMTFISCKKDKDTKMDEPEPITEKPVNVNPYPRPWKTQNISFKNLDASGCGTNHSLGYQIFYKDTLVRSKCGTVDEARQLSNALIVNDSTMFFCTFRGLGAEAIYTRNGGFTWSEKSVGSSLHNKFHMVNPNLTYCITWAGSDYFLTGIEKSDLSVYHVAATKGRYYINDFGSQVTGQDSTVISMNDSLTIVVKFK